MKPVPLHNHSHYSAFDGFSTVDEIVKQINSLDVGAVGLTDHGVISGHLEFGRACVAAGIKPVFGLEAYQARTNRKETHKMEPVEWDEDGKVTRRTYADAFHVILLAKNATGLKNIWALSSLGHTEGWGASKPRIDTELLEKYKEGIIATSACMGSKVAWGIRHDDYGPADELANIFRDDWYIELHTYDGDEQKAMNLELVSLANQKGWPVVYATDAHYACSDDFEFHDTFTNLQRETYHHPPCLWIKGEDGIRESLSYLPKSIVDESIANSERIAEQCNVDLPQSRNRIPVFFPDKPKNHGPVFLVDLVMEEFGKKFPSFSTGDARKKYEGRLVKELNVILDAHLVDFFLIEWDLMRWAKEEGIVIGPGRGSVGGSLVSYVLGITDVDPLRYDLIFERFYNVGREKGGMPDIDSDISVADRPLAKKYLGSKYGDDNVANLGTSLKLGSKSAIRRVAKYLDIPVGHVITMNKIVEGTTDAGLAADWEEIISAPEMQDWIQKYPELFELAGRFHGRIQAYGTHASGFLISDEPMSKNFPMKIVDGEESTQFDMHDAASLGFMKIDLLGLRNLDILIATQKIIKKRHGIDWDFQTLHHKSDEEIANSGIWDMLDNGLTVGLFQVEDGAGAKGIAKSMKCRSVADLGALVALNRPGPLRGGYAAKYLKRRKGEEYDDLHPILHDTLADTYGVFVYQEQIIQYMQAIGFSLEEADEVRSIMGKKKVDKMEEFYPRYLNNARKHMSEKDAKIIWNGILDFSKYGFNKSHAIAYGIILLWTLWTKAKYPSEFMLGCMTAGESKHMARYVGEAVRMGVKVLPPDVNLSELYAAVDSEGNIRMGLTEIKGVGKADWVIENRPFTSYEQMVELMETQTQEYAKLKKEGKAVGPSPKQQFGAGKQKALYESGAFESLEKREWLGAREIRNLQKEYLGIILNNPAPGILEQHTDMIDESCVSYADVEDAGIYTIAGGIYKVEFKKTKTGSDMAWLEMEYEGATIKVAAFGGAMKMNQTKMEECNAVMATVKKTDRGLNLIELTRLT